MTSTDINPVSIPDDLRPILGDPAPGTRMYRCYAPDSRFGEWWDAVCKVCGREGSVSPGGVAMYAKVSRAGVHKRMKEGRLTAFLFHPVTGITRWTKREMLANAGQPYIYIPGDECRQWARLLESKPRNVQYAESYGDGDFQGGFLIAKGRKVGGGKRKR